MRRFELNDSTSNKFWEASVEGKTLTVTFGKIGTSGQTKAKPFATAAEAQAEHDKLVAEKTKKGYREVRGAPAAKPAKSGGSTLDRVDAWLARERADFYASLGKPATAAVIAKLEKRVGKLPPS